MTELSALPSGVFCITLGHSLDDPDVIEYFLEKYPTETEKCLPLALRDMLSPDAEKLGLLPMKIPSARDTLEMLRLIWTVDTYDVRSTLLPAAKLGLAYLIPYILSFIPLYYPVSVSRSFSSRKLLPTNPDRVSEFINDDGGNALVNAVHSGSADTVRVLLLLDANENSRDNALNVAVRQIPLRLDIIDLLLTSTTVVLPDGKTKVIGGADIDESEALGIAASHSNIDAMKFLISRGADVTYWHERIPVPVSGMGIYAPLSMAVDKGNLDTVKFLLDARADIHANNDDALLTAAAGGKNDMVKFLLDAKADSTIDNVLIIAAENNYPDVIKILVTAGADVHINNDEALRSAMGEGSIGAVRALLDLGANMDVITDEEILDGGDEMMDLFAAHDRYVEYEEDED